ncbi:MAG: hypothetical protein ACXVCL_14835, partial [Bdellovibrio sp.]
MNLNSKITEKWRWFFFFTVFVIIIAAAINHTSHFFNSDLTNSELERNNKKVLGSKEKELPQINEEEKIISKKPFNEEIQKPNPGAPLEKNLQAVKDNFEQVLIECKPNSLKVSVKTPEAFLDQLKNELGVKEQNKSVENFHLQLADGSQRRIQILTADNTNSNKNKELRLFKLDPEGYPERLPLQQNENLETLLSSGTIIKHEVKVETIFKDGSSLSA